MLMFLETFSQWITLARFTIHPDWLPLLEPKHGDIIGHHDDDEFYKVVGIEDKGQSYVNRGQGWELIYWDRIIIRDGIVFHWPESEEA